MSSKNSVDEIIHRLGGKLTFVANEWNVDISGCIESGEYASGILITCTAHLHGSISNSQLKKVEITISEGGKPILIEGIDKPVIGVLWKSGSTTNVGIFLDHQIFNQLLLAAGAVNAVESRKLVVTVLPSQSVEDWNGESKIGIDELSVGTRTL